MFARFLAWHVFSEDCLVECEAFVEGLELKTIVAKFIRRLDTKVNRRWRVAH